MPKYRIYGTMYASVYLGEVEAENTEDARIKGGDLNPPHVSLCHHCGGTDDNGQLELGEGIHDIVVMPEEQ